MRFIRISSELESDQPYLVQPALRRAVRDRQPPARLNLLQKGILAKQRNEEPHFPKLYQF